MTEDDSPKMFCGSCGSIFGMLDLEDFDDVRCPECNSQDVADMAE